MIYYTEAGDIKLLIFSFPLTIDVIIAIKLLLERKLNYRYP